MRGCHRVSRKPLVFRRVIHEALTYLNTTIPFRGDMRKPPLPAGFFCVPPVLVEHDVTADRPAILLQLGTIEPKAILDPHAGLGKTNDLVAVDRPGILDRVVDDGIDAGHGWFSREKRLPQSA